jgi:hypothetical protein
MSFRLGIAVVLSLGAAAPALAQEVFECTFPAVANNMNYLPEIVVIARAAGSDVATVVDPMIQHFVGGPIDVKIAAENDAKLSVSWQLMQKSIGNDYVNIAYRVSIQKSSLRASLSGKPMNFSNNFTAQGKCKHQKG